jgi:hypothetical protein
VNHDEPIEVPAFTRMTSLEPKEGYVPSWRFDDCWEESDDTFRARILGKLAKSSLDSA